MVGGFYVKTYQACTHDGGSSKARLNFESAEVVPSSLEFKWFKAWFSYSSIRKRLHNLNFNRAWLVFGAVACASVTDTIHRFLLVSSKQKVRWLIVYIIGKSSLTRHFNMDRYKRGIFVRGRGAPIVTQKSHAHSAQLNPR